MNTSLYTDGGCIGRNPSSLGGTWAWCLVDENGKLLEHESGIVEPSNIGLLTVTNNLTELLAAVKGLSVMPAKWSGIIYTDSLVTLRRITKSQKFNGIPNWLRKETLDLRKNRQWKVILVGGHPSKADLIRGKRKKNGLIVSQWNVFCDKECNRLARKFKEILSKSSN